MKKHLALVLALVMVLTSFSFVSAAPDFSDMEGHVNEEAVARLELLNVLKGYPDGTFKPDDTITRAEFAAVAVRVSGLENVAMAAKGLPTGFSDVPAWHWASGYVGTAAKTGIVVGIGNGLFAPESPVKYEEAITMVVRALGYEPMAQARGGYPFGYLIVANEIDLLDGAMGTQGTWATRGFVAQITDNALEIPMMIQVGYGSDTKWVVSGKENTDEEYLLDRMGFGTVEGRITEVDVDDLEIFINSDDRDDRGWYDVAEGFDFFATEGTEVKAWVDGDMVILVKVQEDVLFDAVTLDGAKIKLVTANKTYDVEDDVDVEAADFAKVVLNDDGDVIWFEAFELDGFIVVEETKDEMVLDLNDDELDVEDYLIVMDGKTISLSDLDEGDVLFYADGEYKDYEGFAVAYNNSKVGEISRVYAGYSFRLDGKTYDLAMGYPDNDAYYLDGSLLGEFENNDILKYMMDEEVEVELFFDFYGDVAVIVGETGEATTSTFYAVLTDDANTFSSRRGLTLAVDVLNEFGEKVSYDLLVADLDDQDIENNLVSTTSVAISTLVEIEVDEDGDIEAITDLTTLLGELEDKDGEVAPFELDDTYAKVDGIDSRLMSSTVIFYDYDAADDDFSKVITLGEVDGEFSKVEDADVYVKNGRVSVVLAYSTDADTDTTEYTGLVTEITDIRGGDVEFVIEVAGEEMEFITSDKFSSTLTKTDGKYDVNVMMTLVVGDTSGEVDSAEYETSNLEEYTVVSVDTSARTITVTGGAITRIELTSDAVIYDDEFDVIRIRDLAKDDVIHVLFAGTSNRWVSYVLVQGEEAGPSL